MYERKWSTIGQDQRSTERGIDMMCKYCRIVKDCRKKYAEVENCVIGGLLREAIEDIRREKAEK